MGRRLIGTTVALFIAAITSASAALADDEPDLEIDFETGASTQQVRFKVSNVGTDDSPGTTARVDVIGDNDKATEFKIPRLNPGETFGFTFNLPVVCDLTEVKATVELKNDPTPTNNTTQVTVCEKFGSDLKLEKLGFPNPAMITNYSFKVTNHGSAPSLPASVHYETIKGGPKNPMDSGFPALDPGQSVEVSYALERWWGGYGCDGQEFSARIVPQGTDLTAVDNTIDNVKACDRPAGMEIGQHTVRIAPSTSWSLGLAKSIRGNNCPISRSGLTVGFISYEPHPGCHTNASYQTILAFDLSTLREAKKRYGVSSNHNLVWTEFPVIENVSSKDTCVAGLGIPKIPWRGLTNQVIPYEWVSAGGNSPWNINTVAYDWLDSAEKEANGILLWSSFDGDLDFDGFNSQCMSSLADPALENNYTILK
jgi:hypothetical protein